MKQMGSKTLLCLCIFISAFVLLAGGRAALEACLVVEMFFVSVVLGSLGLIALYALCGGAWFSVVGSQLMRGGLLSVVGALLFIPIAAGVEQLYGVWALDPVHHVATKQWYLNKPFFLARAFVYWVLWIGIALFFLSSKFRNSQAFAAVSLVVLFFSGSFAAFDWIMSLEPLWYSSIFGVHFLMNSALSALSVVLFGLSSRLSPRSAELLPDLGNLLLCFICLWSYMAFSQFFIIWNGNLPEEVSWYVLRLSAGWQYSSIVLVALHALCFILLLFPEVKGNLVRLRAIAALLIIGRIIELRWLVLPVYESRGDRFVYEMLLWCSALGITLYGAVTAPQLDERKHHAI